MPHRKRYAVVGTGGRCRMFLDAILSTYPDQAQLVGLCDVSQTRLDYHNAENLRRFNVAAAPTYLAADFDRMVAETRPDVVIVTSMDSTHHDYIVRAMDLGCDVICEKPMTTDAEKARAILAAVDRTGRSLRVSFNYRYQPGTSAIKQAILDGAIGTPTAVDFSWILDTRHGADYFRRWHREKHNSGGLLVHKASHHFDLINWWLNSYPQTVFAFAELKFYGKQNAQARGEGDRTTYARYTNESAAKNDPFALFLDSEASLKGLYLDAEADSGYVRDRNVFGGPIDIEDTIALTARYRNGVILSYSLVAYSPWEGLRVAITGTKGRLEFYEYHHSHIIKGQSDAELAAEQNKKKESTLTLFPMFGTPRQLEIARGTGAHGGGDHGLLDRIFNADAAPDPLHRDASHIDGTASILLGISANQSVATGLPVQCADVIDLSGYVKPAAADRPARPMPRVAVAQA